MLAPPGDQILHTFGGLVRQVGAILIPGEGMFHRAGAKAEKAHLLGPANRHSLTNPEHPHSARLLCGNNRGKDDPSSNPS